MFHYLNGKWVRSEDLKISVTDLSVIRGFGCFDFLRTYGNKPFMLKDHIDRFFNSAGFLDLRLPRTKKQIETIAYEGIKKNSSSAGGEDLNIKMILTGGVSKDGITPENALLIMMFTKLDKYPKEQYEKGVKIITVPASRVLPEAKSLNYLTAVLAMQKAYKQKAEEALYVDQDGKMLETTRCNFFVVMKGKLVTPKIGILYGVTRKVVIQLAKKLKLPVIERNLFMGEFPQFSEAFITASNREILPIVKIDNKVTGNGKVGVVTKKLMDAFYKLTHS